MNEWIHKTDKYTFEDLLKIMSQLRSENGCPWDKEQTHLSLMNGTLEEVYEVMDAIKNDDDFNLKEELGDLLLHVVFHSKIAQDRQAFQIEDVIHELVVKLIRRHPHIFRTSALHSAGEVLTQWDAIKKTEKEFISYTQTLQQVPKAMPALLRAYKVQKRAAKVSFDFPNWRLAFDKLYEEIKELDDAIQSGQVDQIEEEYGDLLFSAVNVSRFFEINPEISLTNAVEKFINRFKGIEEMANNKGFDLDKLSIIEMDLLWEAFKMSEQ